MKRTLVLCCLVGAGGAAVGGEVVLPSSLAAGRQWASGAARYQAELLKLMSGPKLPEARTLSRLFGGYALCQFLARADPGSPAGRDAVRWLLANPLLAGTLAYAVCPQDEPARVLAVLGALAPSDRRRKAAAPGVYAAFAVVWDTRVEPGGRAEKGWLTRNARLSRAFAHYAANAERMGVELRRLPWQAAVFVVDSEVTDEERLWALERYGRRGDPGSLYDAVPLDAHRTKLRHGRGHTLADILRCGGASRDRAYFAAHAAKACGRPCILLAGPTRSGVEHAWALTLCGVGTPRCRWAAHGPPGKPEGTYVDPQTQATRSLCDARLLARTLSLPAARRHAAEAYVRVAQLFAGQLPAARTLGLLDEAAQANPYDTRPWLLLSQMMAGRQAAHKNAGTLYRALLGKFRHYPDFTRDILHALLPLIPEADVERRRRLYQATFKVYRKSPRIVAELMTELAEYLHARRKTRAAVATYRSIIEQFREQGHLIDKALQAAEAIYRRHDMLPRAIELYEEAFDAYRDKEDEAVAEGRTTCYYRWAEKLARLCREVGDAAKAKQYSARCYRVDQAIENRKRGTRLRPR